MKIPYSDYPWWKKLFHSHIWKRIGPTDPILNGSEFDNSSSMMAMGECVDCGHREFRYAQGSYSYYTYEKKTKERYCKKYNYDLITFTDIEK